jgi:hypothetical protein
VSTDLERLEQADRLLAQIATASDASDVIRFAEAARVYAQQARLGTSAVNHATVIKMRAERRLAEAVDEGQKKGEIAAKGQPKKAESNIRPPEITSHQTPLTLDDIGVSPQRLQEARKIRDAYTDNDLEEMEEDANAEDRILSRAKLIMHARPAPKPEVTIDPWSQEENDLRSRLEAGETVVISMRAGIHPHLYQWAERKGLFVRIDRRTEWGNPFEMPGDGDRFAVIASYEDFYLPHKPSLHARLQELRGKALGCWCAPEACHGDVLKEWAER